MSASAPASPQHHPQLRRLDRAPRSGAPDPFTASEPAMRYAAFFRNLNLGRPRSPDRAQFEAAFLQSGAASAVSFLVNGTLVYTVQPGLRPRDVAARACLAMRASCGLREPV